MSNPNPYRLAHRSAAVLAGHKIANLNPAHRVSAVEGVAAIYNQAGDGYAAYADGSPDRLFAFDGLHAYADRYVWAVLDA